MATTTTTAAERHTISGPGIDKTVEGSARLALAVAQHAARLVDAPASLYVRDSAGITIYRVDRHADGTIVSYQVNEPGVQADIAAYDRSRQAGRR